MSLKIKSLCQIFISIFICGCYGINNVPKEQLQIKMTENYAEVLNVDSLSTFPPPDSLIVELPPKPMLTVDPIYPIEARRDWIEGTVWTKLWITQGGNVKKAYITSSDNKVFNIAALRAAVQWQFRPAILNGNPVAVWVSVPFRFRLR